MNAVEQGPHSGFAARGTRQGDGRPLSAQIQPTRRALPQEVELTRISSSLCTLRLFHAHPPQLADQLDEFVRRSLLCQNVRRLLFFERHFQFALATMEIRASWCS